MRIRLKQPSFFGSSRIALDGALDKVETRAIPGGADGKRIVLFVKGAQGSGIVMLTLDEARSLLLHAEQAQTEKEEVVQAVMNAAAETVKQLAPAKKRARSKKK